MTDEVKIYVALIALVGVLITALVSLHIANARKRIEAELVSLKAALDQKIASGIQAAKEEHELRLSNLEQRHAIELAEIDRHIQAELGGERTREVLNEANWNRVIGQICDAKNKAHDLIALMKNVCLNGHEISDVQILNDLLGITKLHREFRDAMKPLFGEIRPEDYDRLEAFFKYQGEVILDIDRVKQQRIARQGQMAAHAQRLIDEENMLEALAGHFLRPTLRPQVGAPPKVQLSNAKSDRTKRRSNRERSKAEG